MMESAIANIILLGIVIVLNVKIISIKPQIAKIAQKITIFLQNAIIALINIIQVLIVKRVYIIMI